MSWRWGSFSFYKEICPYTVYKYIEIYWKLLYFPSLWNNHARPPMTGCQRNWSMTWNSSGDKTCKKSKHAFHAVQVGIKNTKAPELQCLWHAWCRREPHILNCNYPTFNVVFFLVMFRKFRMMMTKREKLDWLRRRKRKRRKRRRNWGSCSIL